MHDSLSSQRLFTFTAVLFRHLEANKQHTVELFIIVNDDTLHIFRKSGTRLLMTWQDVNAVPTSIVNTVVDNFHPTMIPISIATKYADYFHLSATSFD